MDGDVTQKVVTAIVEERRRCLGIIDRALLDASQQDEHFYAHVGAFARDVKSKILSVNNHHQV